MSKILVLGQGNIGTFLGAALSDVDHQVSHYLRNPQNDKVSVNLACADRRKENKLKRGGQYVYNNIYNPEEISDFEYVIVSVGHWNVVPAITQIAPYLQAHNKLVISGNVWMGFDQMAAIIPCNWFFAFPNFGGVIREGKLQGWLTPNLTVGTYSAESLPAMKEFVKLLQEASFQPKVEEDMIGWLKTHFAYNAGILLEASKHGGYRKLSQKLPNIKEMYRVTRDFVDHVASLGIDVSRFKDGVQAHRSIFWNSIFMYLIFRLPGVGKNADADYDEVEWRSYAEQIIHDANEKGLEVTNLEAYLEQAKVREA